MEVNVKDVLEANFPVVLCESALEKIYISRFNFVALVPGRCCSSRSQLQVRFSSQAARSPLDIRPGLDPSVHNDLYTIDI